MIRRQPSAWPRGLRRALGPLVMAAATAAVLLVAPSDHRPSPHQAPNRGSGQAGRPATIAKVFHAVGGPVTATVTVTGAPTCRAELVGAGGEVLAGGEVTGRGLTLRALAVAGTPISVVLLPSRVTGLSWQVDLNGARG